MGEPVGEDYSRHSFECNSSCSSTFLDEPVTVVREHLHMHGGKSDKIHPAGNELMIEILASHSIII